MYKSNTTGVTGVSLSKSTQGSESYKAQWVDGEGKNRSRSYNCAQCGKDNAFEMACEYRAKMIAELNKLGHGYSPTHGLPTDNKELA